jgi:golgin subfamily B member 1
VLTGFNPLELTFIVGKHVAMYRPEHYIRALFPTVTELTVLFFAAIKLVAPEQPVPPELANQIKATSERSRVRATDPRRGSEARREEVRRRRCEGEHQALGAGRRADLQPGGLLGVGDLDVAKKIIAAEPQLPGDLTPQEKLRELLVFSVSDRYFKLRAQLGTNIVVQE